MQNYDMTHVVIRGIYKPQQYNHVSHSIDYQKNYEQDIARKEELYPAIEWIQHYTILPTTPYGTSCGNNWYGYKATSQEIDNLMDKLKETSAHLLMYDQNTDEWANAHMSLEATIKRIEMLNGLNLKMSKLL